MQLTVRDAAKLLSVSEATIYRWVRQGELPASHLDRQVRFNRAELLEWATTHGVKAAPEIAPVAAHQSQILPTVVEALTQGGISYDAAGHDTATALRTVVGLLNLPPKIDRDGLLSVLLAREALGSTGIGGGIAIPHVRNPIILHGVKPAISLCFLATPIDFAALDNRPVHILFLLLSPTVPIHLHLLSRLSLLLREPEVKHVLAAKADPATIIAAIKGVEARLRPPSAPPPG
ncbi:MAG: PTS sugar transporter subunit IIA [Deltaproteobacteria bacterium]|nr:PTS sugar transporter subunit IIA [Deltaproteobacteria bacterium]